MNEEQSVIGAAGIVPPSGFTTWVTIFSAAAMAFLAVFALALTLATGRLADRWGSELAQSSTIRVSAPANQLAAETEAVLRVLSTTPGIKSARALSSEEQQNLLTPWFGENVPIDTLPLPQLIDVVEDATGYDADGLRLRLAAEVPGAVLDDHTRWRRPMVHAANRLRLVGWIALGLIGAAMGAMITLAASVSLAANAQVIGVLRLIGARDTYIVAAFVRRYSLRAFLGALCGAVMGCCAILLLPQAQAEGGFLTGLGFQGPGWLWPMILPVVAAVVAYGATLIAARRTLGKLP